MSTFGYTFVRVKGIVPSGKRPLLPVLRLSPFELVPVQSTLQPVKVEPESAVAVRVTDAPVAKAAEHVEPQLSPAGELVTDPKPVPEIEMARLAEGLTCPPLTGQT
ncbi:MAG: hypothetical protein HQL06_01420 [Nitrospirae bacterium]|nr:hypothetical protein [Nitrospirota bacterium]